jgi:hypothetical protein
MFAHHILLLNAGRPFLPALPFQRINRTVREESGQGPTVVE